MVSTQACDVLSAVTAAALALLGVDSTSTSVNFAVLSTCLRQCCCDIDPASNDDRFMNINELSTKYYEYHYVAQYDAVGG